MALVQYQQFTATAWAKRPGRRCIVAISKIVRCPIDQGLDATFGGTWHERQGPIPAKLMAKSTKVERKHADGEVERM